VTELTIEQRRPTDARLEAALRAVEFANRREVGAMLALYRCAKALLPDLIAEVRELRSDRDRLDWLDNVNRSAHQDENHWTIWKDTSSIDVDEITTEGDLRTALDAAIRAARKEQDAPQNRDPDRGG
jgi:hypothetical protein